MVGLVFGVLVAAGLMAALSEPKKTTRKTEVKDVGLPQPEVNAPQPPSQPVKVKTTAEPWRADSVITAALKGKALQQAVGVNFQKEDGRPAEVIEKMGHEIAKVIDKARATTKKEKGEEAPRSPVSLASDALAEYQRLRENIQKGGFA